MRIAFLDCFAGISGDMFLGALLGAGVPAEVLHDAVAALDIGASLRIETVDRSGISSTKVDVFEDGTLAEGKSESELPLQQVMNEAAYSQQPKSQHFHKTGHVHQHHHADESRVEGEPHAHVHGRSLTAIRALIQAAPLAEPVKLTSIRAFELLGQSEAKIHNVPVEDVHFHEVGAVDAIVDIVAASAGIHHLQIGAWFCSPLNVGGGTVVCAHGRFPVPAPATADLLRGVPTYSAHVQMELVTPTGAALIRAVEPVFGQQPSMRVERIGYGAGTRNPQNFPNVLRLSVGESVDAATRLAPVAQSDTAPSDTEVHSQSVTVLETALDDLSPQVLAYVAEKALANGALDVMLTPVIMKKGRPGTLLTVLCHESESDLLQSLIFSETSTLGIRIRRDRRALLDRTFTTVHTAYGRIRVKTGSLSGVELNVAPEYEDCRSAALQHGVPLKQVQQAAMAAYAGSGGAKESTSTTS